jgi:hypothetical protein
MSFRGRGRQLAPKTMITAKKFIVFDVLPRGNTFNQLYFSNNIFSDLKTTNLNFRRQKTGPTFWANRDNSMRHNGSKVMSKIQKNPISRMPHSRYSPDIGPCDCWLFGM